MAICVMICFGHKRNRHKRHQYEENQSPNASIIDDVLDYISNLLELQYITDTVKRTLGSFEEHEVISCS